MPVDEQAQAVPSDDARAHLLRWRGVEDPCPACGGSGVRVYGSTSTWRGGMGGSVCTSDVCDRCWGSGDVHKPWTDLRKLGAEEEKRVAARALGLLLERAGLPAMASSSGREAVLLLVEELERFAGQPRKQRPRWFREIAGALAATLRAGVEAGS